jgi:DNA-binding beta-propeller fold protein YncE
MRSARWMRWMPCWLCLALPFQGCDCDDAGQDPVCEDQDGDGYGPGCPLGADCDDQDASVNFSCDCEVVPRAGCACTDEAPLTCFEASQALLQNPPCHAGQRTCAAGTWGACEGQFLPTAEGCDGLDNDCDGDTDEGAGCSFCGPRCTEETLGHGGGRPFDLTGQEDNGLVLNPDGSIGLEEQGEQIELTFLWVANSDEGTVSKIDTRTGAEVGRYISALYSPDARNRGSASPTGNAPSRTAVDWNGDVWVANRAFGQQGTATKIAHQDCPDADGDGNVETSRDQNGNGVIDLGDPFEYLGEADECILFTVNVGAYDGWPRAMALDAGDTMDGAKNNAWVGVFNEQRFYQLSGQDGRVLAEVDVGLQPYGAAIDSRGVLWATSVDTATLTSIDTRTKVAGPVVSIAGCEGSYGIAIDGQDRVWVGGYGSEQACRYNPADGSSLVVQTPGAGVGRGIAADADGWIWLAHSWSSGGTYWGKVSRFRGDDGSQLQTIDLGPNNIETIGVGLDFDGNAWAVQRNNCDNVAGCAIGSACKIDKATFQFACYPTGMGTYTYSDFTGYALRNFTAPRGTFEHVFTGCAGVSTRWSRLEWDASVPGGTSIKVFVQAAESLAELPAAQRFGPFEESPVDLLAAGEITGQYLRVEVDLASETAGVTPLLRGLSVQRVCGGEQ